MIQSIDHKAWNPTTITISTTLTSFFVVSLSILDSKKLGQDSEKKSDCYEEKRKETRTCTTEFTKHEFPTFLIPLTRYFFFEEDIAPLPADSLAAEWRKEAEEKQKHSEKGAKQGGNNKQVGNFAFLSRKQGFLGSPSDQGSGFLVWSQDVGKREGTRHGREGEGEVDSHQKKKKKEEKEGVDGFPLLLSIK